MLFGLYALGRSREQFWLTAALLLPAMIGNWADFEEGRRLLEVLLSGFLVAFFLLMSILVLRFVGSIRPLPHAPEDEADD